MKKSTEIKIIESLLEYKEKLAHDLYVLIFTAEDIHEFLEENNIDLDSVFIKNKQAYDHGQWYTQEEFDRLIQLSNTSYMPEQEFKKLEPKGYEYITP